MAQKRKQGLELDLFGDPVEELRSRPGAIIPLDFESHAVRMIIIKGESWWVGVDVCRAVGIAQAASSLRLLDDDEKGVHTVHTLGGPQEMSVINLSGVFQLILVSRKDEAKRFKRWLTHEVLPSILKTGTYTVGSPRVKKIQRRLKCDVDTAKTRAEQIDINKERHSFLAAENACVNDYVAWHNGGYRGVFDGREAPQLRGELEISARKTPLDHMDMLPLSTITHAKIIAHRFIEEQSRSGRPIPVEEHAAILEGVAKELRDHAIRRFGYNARFDVRDDPRRGKILDVIQPGCSLN